MIDALVEELKLRKQELVNQKVETIYFGGGTPSLLSTIEIQRLYHAVIEHYNVDSNLEITLEANPDDLTKERIFQLKNSPINRLSIGIQSFFDDDLKSMNRAHTAKEAKESLVLANDSFDNITIDLIYGIPNMDLEKWNDNLNLAFSFKVPHISSYALTVEPKTALDHFIKKGSYPPINDSLALQHFEHLQERTEQHGYIQYEISNFGKEHYFSRHNTAYWKGKHYLGVGPSAHSFDGKQRSWNISNNTKYIDSIKSKVLPNQIEILSEKDRFNEYIMTGLRTIWGVSIKSIESDYGLAYSKHLLNTSEKYLENKLLKNSEGILKTTNKGKFLVDGIASELFMI